MHEERRMVEAGDGEVGIHIVRPDGDGPFPVVLLFHHGPGLDDGIVQAATSVAEGGFCVVCPDRYWRSGPFRTFNVGELMAGGPESEPFQEFLSVVNATNDELVSSDIDIIMTALAEDPAMDTSVIGAIGYCVGARTVIVEMATNPDLFVAGVGMHPSFCVTPEPDSPHHKVSGITGRLHVAVGTADHMAPIEENQPLLDAVAALGDRGSVDMIDGADHGFAVPGPTYHEGVATSYATAAAIFTEALATNG